MSHEIPLLKAAMRSALSSRTVTSLCAHRPSRMRTRRGFLFALVLLFAGISTNLDNPRAQQLLVVAAVIVFVIGAVIVATFPKEI